MDELNVPFFVAVNNEKDFLPVSNHEKYPIFNSFIPSSPWQRQYIFFCSHLILLQCNNGVHYTTQNNLLSDKNLAYIEYFIFAF